jgi:Protein of unknown function (DUF3313)
MRLMTNCGRRILVGMLVATVIVSGCTATRARRGAPEGSGFLGDYANLQKNPDYPAALVYVKPGVQWARYNAIQLESARLYLTESTSKLSAEDQERLVGMLYNTLSAELDKYFRLVTAPEPNALRLRVALTQAKGAMVVARTVTTVIPQLRLLSTIGGLATDTAATVGTATVEMEAVDSTNDRLAAAVDERAGTKALFAKRAYQEWGDVQAAMDYWSKRLTWQLARHGVQLKPGASMPEEPKESRSL